MKIDRETLEIIGSAEIADNVVSLTCGQLDRKQYVAVDKVFKALGGKWNKKLKGHQFDNDPTCAVEEAINSGEVVDAKQVFQAFFTTPELAQRVVDMASIDDNSAVLEPSAGDGAILSFIVHEEVDYCEIQDDLREELANNFGATNVGSDFLEYNPGPIYDRIIANPPFTRQQDIDHVSHMVDCLAEGGRIVSIMSAGVRFRTNKKTKEFFEKIDREGCSFKFEEVEDGAFKSSGTMVKTTIIVIDKDGYEGN